MASPLEISTFLAEVQKRAFRQANFAVKDEEVAIELVQDAMAKLVEKYHGKPAEELPPLFQRILQNAVNDHFRKSKIRNLWTTALSNFSVLGDDGDEGDILEVMEVEGTLDQTGVISVTDRKTILAFLEEGLGMLPARQREAFVLRYWEEYSTEESAEIMGCSEGSVKTHCSRACSTLAEFLRKKGVDPSILINTD